MNEPLAVREAPANYRVVPEAQRVRPGYKQTKVGLIPEDWEASTIGENSKWMSGGTPLRNNAEFWSGTIPWISGSTLKSAEISTSDQFLTAEAVSAGSKMAPVDSTLLLVRGSALHNEIRAGLVVLPVAFNQDVKALVPNVTVEPKFLTYYILAQSDALLKLVSSAGNSAGVLDTKLVQDFKFLSPPLLEQRAIVAALSDADALIEALEQLIAKKRNLKQGSMQELLTGKKRLPGFSGEWEVKRLGDVAIFYKGKGLPKSALGADGKTPCIHYGELFTRYSETISEIISYTNTSDGTFRSVANDVLMPTSDVTPRGLAKASCVRTDDVILGGDILVIRSDTKLIFGSFLSYLIRYEEKQVLQLVSGSTVFHLYGTDMKKFTFSMPHVSEQTAIATILSDMDAEIAALETRLAKTRELKQGMMHNLLTGRIRLI
jgi:type I restriction enzyme, S subunit